MHVCVVLMIFHGGAYVVIGTSIASVPTENALAKDTRAEPGATFAED